MLNLIYVVLYLGYFLCLQFSCVWMCLSYTYTVYLAEREYIYVWSSPGSGVFVFVCLSGWLPVCSFLHFLFDTDSPDLALRCCDVTQQLFVVSVLWCNSGVLKCSVSKCMPVWESQWMNLWVFTFMQVCVIVCVCTSVAVHTCYIRRVFVGRIRCVSSAKLVHSAADINTPGGIVR